MKDKWHRITIEALGMYGPKSRVLNKLNEAFAHSNDQQLRAMIDKVISEVKTAGSSTEQMAVKEMKNGVPSARKLLDYCEACVASGSV